jgi:phosphoglycolate phosphatase
MYLIFDFDGTLVNSFHSVIEQFNHLADEFEFRKVNKDEINSLRDLNSQEIINYLQIPLYKIPNIIFRVRQHLHDIMLTLDPVPHLPQVLQQLHQDGWSLGILTSNSTENVKIWLHQHNMMQLFNFIREESNFFSKKYLLRKIIKAHKIDKSKAFYIGDETRDIEAAKKSDIYSIAVTWGFNSEKALVQYQPHHIARVPEDILTILHC